MSKGIRLDFRNSLRWTVEAASFTNPRLRPLRRSLRIGARRGTVRRLQKVIQRAARRRQPWNGAADTPDPLRLVSDQAGIVLKVENPRAVVERTAKLDAYRIIIVHEQHHLVGVERLAHLPPFPPTT